MLSKKSGRQIMEYVPDYVVFDIETTGTSCNYDEVIEIAGVRVQNGEVIEEFSSLVDPGRPIPFYASQVNGITDEMVEDYPDFEEVLLQFMKFVGKDVLVGHNIHTFDMKFLYRDAGRFWNKTIGNDYIDTLRIARAYLPQLSHHKLTDLAEYFGISCVGAHRALSDCRMNQRVFECLAKEMGNPSGAAKGIKKCPICQNILIKRKGKYGMFFGCSSYPDCRYTEDA